jgi:hypothetical protein
MFTVMCNFELGLHQKENYLTRKLGAEVVDNSGCEMRVIFIFLTSSVGLACGISIPV